MSDFVEGFPLGGVVEVRVRSYTVGPGKSAQLVAIELEVWRDLAVEPEPVEVTFERVGPSLATAQAVVASLNRRLKERRDAEQ